MVGVGKSVGCALGSSTANTARRTRVATEQAPTNASTCIDAGSSQWASSTMHKTARQRSCSSSRRSTARPMKKRSISPPARSPKAAVGAEHAADPGASGPRSIIGAQEAVQSGKRKIPLRLDAADHRHPKAGCGLHRVLHGVVTPDPGSPRTEHQHPRPSPPRVAPAGGASSVRARGRAAAGGAGRWGRAERFGSAKPRPAGDGARWRAVKRRLHRSSTPVGSAEPQSARSHSRESLSLAPATISDPRPAGVPIFRLPAMSPATVSLQSSGIEASNQ